MQLFGSVCLKTTTSLPARKAPYKRSLARRNRGHADVDSWCALGIRTGTAIGRSQSAGSNGQQKERLRRRWLLIRT